MKEHKIFLTVLFLAVLSFGIFTFNLNTSRPAHTDSLTYATIAREMIQNNNWIIPTYNGNPDFWKPPLWYWMIAVVYIILGVSTHSAILASVILACAGVLLTFFLGKLLFNYKAGLIAALALMTNIQYHDHARLVMMDLGLCVLILAAFYLFIKYSISKKPAFFYGFFVFSALATLMKGVQGFFIAFAIIGLYCLFTRQLRSIFNRHAIFGGLIFLAISVPWFVAMSAKFGKEYVRFFFFQENLFRITGFQVSPLKRLSFMPVSALTTIGPFSLWSLFLVAQIILIIKNIKNVFKENPGLIFISLWAGVLFLVFSTASAQAARYFMPVLPALALLIGYYFSRVEERLTLSFKIAFVFMIVLGLVITFAAQVLWYYLGYESTFLIFLPAIVYGILVLPPVIAYSKGMARNIPYLMSGVIVAILILGYGFVVPRVDLRPTTEFIKTLSAVAPDGSVVVTDTHRSERELIYSTNFKVRFMDNENDIAKFISTKDAAYIIITKVNYDRIPQKLRPRILLIRKAYDLRRVSAKELKLKELIYQLENIKVEYRLYLKPPIRYKGSNIQDSGFNK